MDARQPRIRLARPDVGEGEIDAIRRVFASGVLTNGPETAAFEREFAERHAVQHAVALANGTVALAAMLLAVGVEPGDEVIVPSMTFISTATSVLHVGATPVFADIRPDTFNIDPADVARRITPRTRAVLAVHYAGQPAAMDALRDVCAEHGVVLLEDAAQAHGAAYQGVPAGAWGRAAMFSFTPTKNITTGEGAVVTTVDPEIDEKLRLLRNHGQTALYRHEVLGYNWRLTEMQSAMGRVQLDKLDEILKRKRENAAWLSQRLGSVSGVTPPYVAPGAEPVFMLYTVLLDESIDRDGTLQRMLDAGIECRIYFPPAHRQPVFAREHIELPVTDAVTRRMLSLPMHAQLTPEELADIADTLERSIG